MKNFYFTLSLFLVCITTGFTQVGIGTTTPVSSSILDITSPDKGILIPRMDLGNFNDASPVINPEKSLLVWNTDLSNGSVNEGFYYWNGTLWVKFAIEEPRVFSDKYNSDDIMINANSPISFDTIIVNKGVNSGNTYYTIPKDGFYRVTFSVTFEKQGGGLTSSGIYSFYLSKAQNPSSKIDGTLVRTEIPNQFSVSNVFLSKIIYLEAGENIYLMSQRNVKVMSESSYTIEYINQ